MSTIADVALPEGIALLRVPDHTSTCEHHVDVMNGVVSPEAAGPRSVSTCSPGSLPGPCGNAATTSCVKQEPTTHVQHSDNVAGTPHSGVSMSGLVLDRGLSSVSIGRGLSIDPASLDLDFGRLLSVDSLVGTLLDGPVCNNGTAAAQPAAPPRTPSITRMLSAPAATPTRNRTYVDSCIVDDDGGNSSMGVPPPVVNLPASVRSRAAVSSRSTATAPALAPLTRSLTDGSRRLSAASRRSCVALPVAPFPTPTPGFLPPCDITPAVATTRAYPSAVCGDVAMEPAMTPVASPLASDHPFRTTAVATSQRPPRATTTKTSRRRRRTVSATKDSVDGSISSGSSSAIGTDSDGSACNTRRCARPRKKRRATAEPEFDEEDMSGLTSAERAKRRRELRLKRNRESAFRSRLRRKAQNERMVNELRQLRVVADDQRKDVAALRHHVKFVRDEVSRLRAVLRRYGASSEEVGIPLPAVPAPISGPIPEPSVKLPAAPKSAASSGSGGGQLSPIDDGTDAAARHARATAGRVGMALMAVVFAFSLCLFNVTDVVHHNAMPAGFAAGNVGAPSTPLARGRALHSHVDSAYDAAAQALAAGHADGYVVPSDVVVDVASPSSTMPTPRFMPSLWSPTAFVTLVFHVAGVPELAEVVMLNVAIATAALTIALFMLMRWSAGVIFTQPTYYSSNGSHLPTVKVSSWCQRCRRNSNTTATTNAATKARAVHTKKKAASHGKTKRRVTPTAFPTAASAVAAATHDEVEQWYRDVCLASALCAPPLSRAASESDMANVVNAKDNTMPVVPRGVGAVFPTADGESGKSHGRRRSGTDPAVGSDDCGMPGFDFELLEKWHTASAGCGVDLAGDQDGMAVHGFGGLASHGLTPMVGCH